MRQLGNEKNVEKDIFSLLQKKAIELCGGCKWCEGCGQRKKTKMDRCKVSRTEKKKKWRAFRSKSIENSKFFNHIIQNIF